VNNTDVKVKFQAVNKEIYNLIIAHHELTVMEITNLLGLQKQRVRRHIMKLLEHNLLSASPNIRDVKYKAINVLNFKEYQEKDMAHYLVQNVKKNLERSLSTMPAHIQEAIASGLISADIVNTYSPLENTPEKFKHTPKPYINMAWHGYSVYNML
jgi:predicted transcriptional regulator